MGELVERTYRETILPISAMIPGFLCFPVLCEKVDISIAQDPDISLSSLPLISSNILL